MIPALLGLLAARRRGSGGGPGGNDANTLLLLHFDGADGATSIADSSVGGAHANGTSSGGAVVDDAQFKFGGTSMYFDGTGDSQLLFGADADWDLGTAGSQDFTIDFWIRFESIGSSNGIIATYDGTDGYQFYYSSNGNLNLWSSAPTDTVATGGLSIDTWYHIALERSGSTITAFLDGFVLGTFDDRELGHDGNAFAFGMTNQSSTSNRLQGWVDEFRLSNVARYGGSAFTPETAPYD